MIIEDTYRTPIDLTGKYMIILKQILTPHISDESMEMIRILKNGG
jgi:hypothetical protein